MPKEKTIKKEFKVKSNEIPKEDSQQLEIGIIKALKNIKQAFDTVPDYIPKTPDEQIYYYKNSTTFRVYFYISNEWKYVGLS
jgi:hypothetical protein